MTKSVNIKLYLFLEQRTDFIPHHQKN